MGLTFGIHVMRGISLQAFSANTPILDTAKGSSYVESGRQWGRKDIGLKERACAWMLHGFMSANTKLEAGRAFLRSLYLQYAEWGVDYVKNDCVFGDDLDINEITFVSEVLQKLDRPILYSLSPGTSVTPAMAKEVSGLVNVYRITGDDWDTWRDVLSHFDVTRDFSNAKMIGANDLLGKLWPDLDMLPLGWLTDPGSNEGPHKTSNLNIDEQRTQMTLWIPKQMAGQLKLSIKISNKSAGGRNWGVEMIYKQQYEGTLHLLASDGMKLCLDASPRRRLTSKEFGGGSFSPCKRNANQMWELNANGSLVNSYSGLCATVDLVKDDAGSSEVRSWIATGRRGEIYLAFFNLNPVMSVMSANLADVAKVLPWKNMKRVSCKYHEIWSGKSGVTKQLISIAVEKHGSSLFVLTCA
ncbi:O-fucosyltransferase family protein isoform 1 [Hibiscus syriacus]|uniref:alpha-galactosidase n=1 Tax=Hibiscus syriacus TaxID=106335 RepID=A0A6A2ZA54_HIBSY|nr:O-fucosyltransferase family protein isoform 1 [Hibiscus syriacus]